jgi:tetratricopeptide (TPR) repeat protein
MVGRTAEGAASIERAHALALRLVKAQPEVLLHASELAEICNRLGVFYRRLKKPVEARRFLDEARTIQEGLRKQGPDVLAYQSGLAATINNLATLDREQGNLDGAVAGYRESIRLTEELMAKGARNTGMALGLRSSYLGLAEMLVSSGHAAEAAPHWQKVLELSPDREKPMMRGLRARLVARTGDYAPAVREAEEIVAGRVPRATIYDLACVYAMASAAVKSDENVPTTERETRAEDYAREALGFLERFRSSGAFDEPSQVKRVKEDKDLHALRGRPDFQKFLQMLGSP